MQTLCVKLSLVVLFSLFTDFVAAQSLEHVHLAYSAAFYNFAGVEDTIGYFITGDSTYKWTTSEGWTTLHNPFVNDSAGLRNIFLSPNGVLYESLGNETLTKSTDEGRTFSLIPNISGLTPKGELFFSASSAIFRSSDEGITWDTILLPEGRGGILVSDRGGNLFDFCSPFQSVYGLSYRGKVLDSITTPSYVSGGLTSCSVASENLLVSCQQQDSLYYTTNSGLTWVVLPPPFLKSEGSLKSMCCDSEGRIYAASQYGFFPRSLDTGKSWELLDSSLRIDHIHAVALSCFGYVPGLIHFR